MRITSILMALLIVGGLYYWFVGRHDGMGTVPSVGQTADTSATTDKDASADAADDKTNKTRAEDIPVPVVVIDSVARETAAELVLRGRTMASRNVQVSAETTGRVVSEPLRRGARVDKNDVLCRLDPGIRAAELAEAEARLAEATVEAEAATRLNERGFAAETTLRTRQAQLGAAQARLDRVKWDIKQLQIRAPFDGFLESDTAELGALLAPGGVCATVIDLGQIKMAGFVAEQEVDQLRVGQKAKARLINGYEAEGKISFISRVADPQTRTYAVEVLVDNPDGKLRDGMTAEMRIKLPGEKAHFLPQSALTLNDDGTLGVRIDEDGTARFVPVTLLRDEIKGFWVTGLPDTARVIVVGQEFVTDGRRVTGNSPSWTVGQ